MMSKLHTSVVEDVDFVVQSALLVIASDTLHIANI